MDRVFELAGEPGFPANDYIQALKAIKINIKHFIYRIIHECI